VDYPLSTTLIDLWVALGYNGKKVANNRRKLTLLRRFRDLLVLRYTTMLNIMLKKTKETLFNKLSHERKDEVQFDTGEAYGIIIELLEKELEEKELFNLLTWKRVSGGPDQITQERQVMLSIINYQSGQTVHDLLNAAIPILGPFVGKPPKYLVFCYEGKPPEIDLEQPESLSMETYFLSYKDNTSYKLFGVISHCGEDTTSGNNLAYRLIDGMWYYFNDHEVYAISEYEIGKVYGWENDNNETAYLAFFEQI
jgi:hypothetical protein